MSNDFQKLTSIFNTNYHICYYGVDLHTLHGNTIQYIKDCYHSNMTMRKMTLFYQNKPMYFNISDNHIEIDFEILGVHTIHIFHMVFNHLKDSNRERKIIVCYNIDSCRQDLVQIFHSFLKYKRFKFIFLTRKPSSIPNNISRRCLFICNKVNNGEISYYRQHESFCEIIINNIKTLKSLSNEKANIKTHLIELRENIYLLLIHNLNIYDCMYYIFSKCIEYKIISFTTDQLMLDYMNDLINDYKQFNMNHRVIYHIEKNILKVIELNI